MARMRAVAQTTAVALAAATAKTVLQLVAPTNIRVAVKGYSVSFDGASGTAVPTVFDVVRQTSAGTMSALTPVKDVVAGSETLQTTAQHTATGTEPTTTDILRSDYIHPQTGIEYRNAFDEEIIMAGGTRLGLRITAPAVVNVRARFMFEE